MMHPVILIFAVLAPLAFQQDCDPSEYFDGQHCSPCQQNCICSADHTCTSCMPGYTFDSLFKNCLQCPTASSPTSVGCSDCCFQIVQTAYVCSTCPDLPYTYLIGGQCITLDGCTAILPSGSCETCDDGYYAFDGQCQQCDISCATCMDSTFCLTCSAGYYNNSNSNLGTCAACPNGCSFCSGPATCTGCLTSFRLTAPSCTACSTLCTMCNAGGCTKCSSGYAAVGGACQPCSNVAFGGTAGCLQCYGLSNVIKCEKCLDNYYMASNQACYSCTTLYPNSARCTQLAPLQCINDDAATLNSRYYLFGGNCVANTKNCKRMKDSSGACSSCYFEQGAYYQLQSGVCNLCVKPGCQTFSSTCQCLSCQSGYQFINSQCIQCQNPHCYNCQASVSTCQQCAPYYGIMSSACISCVQPMCLNCDGNTTLCVTCEDGYYNNQGICYLCQDSCLLCSSSTSCSSCSDGYYLHSSGRCRAKPTNCMLVDTSGNCTKCQYGYMEDYGSCFPCSPSSFNMHQCERYCPSYYALKVSEYCLGFLYALSLVLALLY